MRLRSWVLGMVCGAACIGIAAAGPPAPAPAPPAGAADVSRPPPARVLPTPPGYKKAELTCAKNSDCVMATEDSCCGSCGLAQPFAAISKRTQARRTRDLARMCSRVDMDCDQVHCSGPRVHTDPSCVVIPRCQKGRCVVVASASCLPATVGTTPPPPPACTTADDCALATAFSCCGDCGPGFPFVALDKATAAARRASQERACSLKDVDCSTHKCSGGAPPGCEAKVMCTNGTCAVRTTGRCPAPPAG